MSYQPIENYGIIGDLYTTALVGMDGSIDFMCFPHFDSPSVFAAMLDDQRGGRFRIAPMLEEVRHRQLYLPDTNVLITRFLSKEGVAEIVDFMPVEEIGNAHNIVRRVKTIRGSVRYQLSCAPRFDYGRAEHTLEASEKCIRFASEGSDGVVLRLRSTVPLQPRDGAASAEFTLAAGEQANFILDDGEDLTPFGMSDADISRCLQHTRSPRTIPTDLCRSCTAAMATPI